MSVRRRTHRIQHERGYAAVGLFQPKTPVNVGSALRAAQCYGASFVAMTGDRYRNAPTDTQSAVRHLPLIRTTDLSLVIPFDCVPVAVELLEGAYSLINYVHPERAFYIFGPEDGSLGAAITSWCRDTVFVPTAYCMNLAATVNVVLYDRMAKQAVREADLRVNRAAQRAAGIGQEHRSPSLGL